MSEKIQGLSIGLDLDSIGVDNGLKTLRGKLALVNSEMRANLSAFDRGEKSMQKYETQLTGLNKKLEVQKVSVKAAKDEYDEMVKRHGESSKQAEKAAEIYNKQQAAFNNLERYVGSLNEEMKEFEKQQQLASSNWTKVGDRLDKTGQKLNAFGQNMQSAGKSMSMYITAPLTAIGAASFKAAVDFESAFAGVRKTVDTSEAGFAKLSDGIRDMAKELPVAATDIAAVAESAGQLGIAEENILDFTQTIIDLGESTNLTREQAATEFARFANIVQMPQENFDRLGSSVVSLGNNLATTESEIVSMGMRLAGTGAQIGLTEAEIMALAASMSSVGIEAEAGGSAMSTVLKKMQNAVSAGGQDLKDFATAAGMSTSEFAKSFEEKPIEALDAFIKGLATSSENGENLNGILDNLGIKGIREADTVLRLAGASELLGDAVGLATEAWETNTALSDEAAQRYETMASKLTMLKNRFTDVAIETGNVLAPKLMDLADKVENVVDWYSELSEESKNAIIMFGGLAAAIGPLLVVGGTLIAGLGSALTLMGTVSGAIAVMTTGAVAATPAVGALASIFTVLTGPVGLAIAAIGGLTVAGVLFAKHMSEDAIPEVDRFGDQVSETTKEALGEFFELSDGVALALSEMKITGAKVTDEMAEEMVGKYAAMNDQILEGMKTRHEEQLTTMQDFFANSSALTDEEETKILEKEIARNNQSIETQQYYADKVKEIYETAAAEKRETTERENEIIDTINQRMQENAVSYLTESEIEQQIIMQRIKDSAGELSAQQAAEVVRRAAEQRDGTIAAAEEEYESRIAEIIRLRDESGTISDEQATKLIADAKKTRDESVRYAESMHADVVEQAKLQAGEHVELINWTTGEILSKWEVFKNDYQKFSEEFSKSAIEAFGRMATGIISKMTTGSQTVLDIKASMVNGVIKGLNWILEKLDMKTFPLWSPVKIATGNRKAPTTTAVKAYAHGTDSHPGGWALVGDGIGDNAGAEYIQTPDGKHGFSPATNTLLDLPKGTKVLSAKKTRELFGPVPRYANGIGDIASHIWDTGKDVWNAGKKKVFDIFDYFTDPKKLLDIGLSAVGFSAPSAGGFMKDVISGSMSTIKKGAVDFIKKALTDFGGSGGLGFGSAFRKTSSYGYRIHPILGVPQLHAGDDYGAPVGTPIPAQAGGRVTVSGFHPIRGNYVRIKSGILERIYQHNARNLVNTGDMVKQGQYIGTVGSTGRSTGPHLHYEVLRNGVNINPKGLATGGITNGFMVSSLHEEGYPEFVIPTAPNRRSDAMKLLALAYKKIGGGDRATRPDQLPDVSYQSDHTNKIIEKLSEQVQETKEIVSLLTQLLLKDSNTYLDGRKIEQYVSEQQSINSKVRSVF